VLFVCPYFLVLKTFKRLAVLSYLRIELAGENNSERDVLSLMPFKLSISMPVV
jgi:hypothetical protein